MNAITENILREAADAFAFDRTTGEISRYGEGHINDTFVVWASDKCKRYIMQRINTDTFKNPKELMENVCHVTGFLRKVILEKGGDGFATVHRASDIELVRNLVAEGLPLGGLWYSDYLDAR